MPIKVGIGICTYKRPYQLKTLLESIETLSFEKMKTPRVHLVVVDNDGACSALSVVQAHKSQFHMSYISEPRQGISYARNTALKTLKELSCDYIVFVDDDETMDGRCVDELLFTSITLQAKLVKGVVTPVYPEGDDQLAKQLDLHKRSRYQTGTKVGPWGLANLLFRMETLEESDLYFDERLALTGGEDTELLERLGAKGFEIIFCNEAIVYETIPLAKMKLGWFIRRQFRCGTSDGYMKRKQNKKAVIPLTFTYLGKLFIRLIRILFSIPYGFHRMFKEFMILVNFFGVICGLYDFVYEEYKECS